MSTIAKAKKVLVIRLSSLGDVTLATAALAPLQAAACEIHFLTKTSFAPLLQGHPWIKNVYEFDKSNARSEREARRLFYAYVEKEKFDFVLDLHDSLRTRFWRFHLRKVTKVYVAKKERLREILILLFRLGKWFGLGRGGRAIKMRTAAGQALQAEGIFSANSADETLTKLTVNQNLAQPFHLPQEFAVFLPGSAWVGKVWPYFPELAMRISKKMPIIALGGVKDFQCDLIATEASKNHAASKSLRGVTNIQESMAILSLASIVVGNDTGMIHVAEALGKNVIMIEGPTEKSLGFSPYRKESKLAGLDLFCRPCSKSGRICFRFGTRKCMKGLLVSTLEKLMLKDGE